MPSLTTRPEVAFALGILVGWVVCRWSPVPAAPTPGLSERTVVDLGVSPRPTRAAAPEQHPVRQSSAMRRRQMHAGEVEKQELWCRAMATARKGSVRSTKAAFDQNVDSYAAGGHDSLFQHNHKYLGSSSVVVEIGGNKGIFAQKIVDRYHPGAVHVIEPVSPMVKALTARFAKNPEVKIHQFALAREGGEMRMAYRSQTDAAAKILRPGQPLDKGWEGATVETVPLLTFDSAWQRMGVEMVDLMNINIEGIEFELVDALLQAGMQKKIRNIQIQFHVHAGVEVPDKIGKRCGFHKILRETHELVYNFDWVWEQWVLRE